MYIRAAGVDNAHYNVVVDIAHFSLAASFVTGHPIGVARQTTMVAVVMYAQRSFVVVRNTNTILANPHCFRLMRDQLDCGWRAQPIRRLTVHMNHEFTELRFVLRFMVDIGNHLSLSLILIVRSLQSARKLLPSD